MNSIGKTQNETLLNLNNKNKVLQNSVDIFSKLNTLSKGYFISYNEEGFKIHKDNFINRIIYFSRSAPLSVLDNSIVSCAKLIEQFRLDFNPSNEPQSYNDQLGVLQNIQNTLPPLLLNLKFLKNAWKDAKSHDKINAISKKLIILDHHISSLNNLIVKHKICPLLPGEVSKPMEPADNFFAKQYIYNLLNHVKCSNDSYFTHSSVKDSLAKIFGEEFTVKMLNMYQLQNVHFVSTTDLKALVQGFMANMTLDDLKYIRQSEDNKALFKSLDHSASDVKFLSKLRRCRFFTQAELKKVILKNPPYYYQLEKDRLLLKSFRSIKHFDLANTNVKTADLQNFSHAEYLSRQIIYYLYPFDDKTSFREGTLIPVRNNSGEIVLMQAHNLQNKNGLFGAVLIPSQVDEKSSTPVPVQIVFRGTCNMAAWYRNLSPTEKTGLKEINGPGARSFALNKKTLLNNLENALSQLPSNQPLKIELTGHSLGSSDAQRMCAALTSRMAEVKKNKESSSPFLNLNIKEVNFFGFNSPGIEKKINNTFFNSAKELPEIKFQLRYFKAHHDFVQTVGNFVLGYHTKKNPLPKNVFTTAFKFARPQSALGWNPANRFGLIPHTQLNIHARINGEKTPNDVWIMDIRTNNPIDVGIKFHGSDSNNEPLQSTIDLEAARKTLRHQRWISTLFHKLINLIVLVSGQIKKSIKKALGISSPHKKRKLKVKFSKRVDLIPQAV